MTGREKPVIAMVHFPPLPGSPLYDGEGGVAKIERWVANALEALVDNGVDAVPRALWPRSSGSGRRPAMMSTSGSQVVPSTSRASRPSYCGRRIMSLMCSMRPGGFSGPMIT